MSSDLSDLALPAGTPVIIVGLGRESKEPFMMGSALPQVYAGRLVEPHRWFDSKHRSLLLEGPFAGSISPNGVESKVFGADDNGAGFIILTREEPDERGCISYLVLEDVRGIVAGMETVEIESWDGFQVVQYRLYTEVMGSLQCLFHTHGSPFTS